MPVVKKIDYKVEVGRAIQRARVKRNLTQLDLAKKLGTSQSAINRVENGRQNISLDMVSHINQALNIQLLSVNDNSSTAFYINGGRELSGEVAVNTSKNSCMGLLAASLLNGSKTTLKNVSKIEEVQRIIEVFKSMGVKVKWVNGKTDLEIDPPKILNIEHINLESARKTRSIILLLGSLLHKFNKFKLPFAGGCSLGERTVEPHLQALHAFGLQIDARCDDGFYSAVVKETEKGDKKIVLIERGDTVTENAIIAASLWSGKTTIVNASSNYMVQDVCFYLQKLGVQIDGIGTTTLVVRGKSKINKPIEYCPSEDPIEAMSFLAAGIVTKSEITVKRVPIEFLAIELEILKSMNLKFTLSDEYFSNNGRTRLVDLTIHKSTLFAPVDKIHPMPYPGLNIDNLPFFVVIAATAEGRTLIHDWVFENRSLYFTELSRLNAKVQLLDAHRVFVDGPTNWRPADMMTPPALRPAMVIMLAMLATSGKSILRNIYAINRGYADFTERLNRLGANIETVINA
ncbi:MAG: UDP-N-acetylglucosamine 1-carboxyvinyltransferase [Candidatus Nomurabacteria bacterium]|jgi:UDP-N-acetylglucosamine 1-carboxyvinyltransferase|nr:UDP-N-acetylglucosamine 1-carboxyvinyltransferase [Candidatus Nomurabacteria bacterium]